MKETLIDIETYCEADIKKCGLYRYVSDPSFEILLIAWATDEGEGFGETKLADLASGDPFPKELLDDFKDSDVTLIAHNAAFERVSFSRYLQQHYPGRYLKPGTFLSPDNWICTMVMAASLTLPMALKDVGEVLRTTQQKDEEGKRLIKLFSAPCKPTKSNGGRTRNLPHHLPEDWEKFKYYRFDCTDRSCAGGFDGIPACRQARLDAGPAGYCKGAELRPAIGDSGLYAVQAGSH